MTVKILEKTKGCMPVIFPQGEWIDLTLAQDVTLKAPQANKLHRKNQKTNSEIRTRDVDFFFELLPLGICVQLPKGYEAHIVPRSSTFKRYAILQTNSMGIIDASYCSEKDEWKLPVLPTKEVTIPKGTRLAQFKITLSQKATFWQKLKWLFSSRIKLKKVTHLNNKPRGGFGSTGK